MKSSSAWLRRILEAAWIAAILGCIAIAVVAAVGDTVVVRGASMAPAIPRGALVTLDDDDLATIGPGDVVTVRGDNGVLVTHRVVRIVSVADGTFLELRGDANRASDPALVPVGSVVGRIGWVLPHAGYLLTMLATPMGLLSVLAFLGAGALAIGLLEDAEAARRSGTAFA